ncbi:hypothetical protein ACQKWADRAFT_291371 [Trichoderma austrokoningii]
MEIKAPKACHHCHLHKRRCDKRLPRCSRCASKFSRCEYGDSRPLEAEPITKLRWSESLAIQRESCGLELTPAGEGQLLWAACQSQESYSRLTDAQRLLNLTQDIFAHGGTSAQQVWDSHFATAYSWLPVLEESNIHFNILVMQESDIHKDVFGLLLLCMYLLNQAPCYHPNHTSNSLLHKTTSRVFSLVEASGHIFSHATKLQAGLLLAAYECGHGMTDKATSTLGACFGIIRQLDSRRQDILAPVLKRCWAGIISLDRTIVLSCADSSAALLIPAKDMLPPDAISYLGSDGSSYMDRAHLFRLRTRSALLVGEAMKAVYGDPTSAECIEAEKLLHTLVREHAASKEESYPVCEGISMALSAVVSAYKKRVQRIGSTADAKLTIDIKFAYNIAFDMCRVEGSIMRTRDKGLDRLCFAGLGCLYRAAVDLDEMYPGGASPEDAKQLRENLEWFSGRWKVAGVLLRRLDRNALLRSRQIPTPTSL